MNVVSASVPWRCRTHSCWLVVHASSGFPSYGRPLFLALRFWPVVDSSRYFVLRIEDGKGMPRLRCFAFVAMFRSLLGALVRLYPDPPTPLPFSVQYLHDSPHFCLYSLTVLPSLLACVPGFDLSILLHAHGRPFRIPWAWFPGAERRVRLQCGVAGAQKVGCCAACTTTPPLVLCVGCRLFLMVSIGFYPLVMVTAPS